MTNIRFLGIRFRAFAQATEVEERVLEAMKFATGTEDIQATRIKGHFGNCFTVFEVELTRSSHIRPLLARLAEAGVLGGLAGTEDLRMDDGCVLHFRMDKQKAYLEELCLASGPDVIDVRFKVAVYPAKREAAVRAASEWLAPYRK